MNIMAYCFRLNTATTSPSSFSTSQLRPCRLRIVNLERLLRNVIDFRREIGQALVAERHHRVADAELPKTLYAATDIDARLRVVVLRIAAVAARDLFVSNRPPQYVSRSSQ